MISMLSKFKAGYILLLLGGMMLWPFVSWAEPPVGRIRPETCLGSVPAEISIKKELLQVIAAGRLRSDSTEVSELELDLLRNAVRTMDLSTQRERSILHFLERTRPLILAPLQFRDEEKGISAAPLLIVVGPLNLQWSPERVAGDLVAAIQRAMDLRDHWMISQTAKLEEEMALDSDRHKLALRLIEMLALLRSLQVSVLEPHAVESQIRLEWQKISLERADAPEENAEVYRELSEFLSRPPFNAESLAKLLENLFRQLV